MTLEQLVDEIEKLAEAATPGPWTLEDYDFITVDDAFLIAMRNHALTLIKALREAWEERDKYKAALDAELPAAWREDIESLNSCLERIGKERDEARAEVERLKAALDEERAMACEEPDPKCSCPGCSYAREKAALKEGDR